MAATQDQRDAFADRVKALRRAAGRTQAEVAAALAGLGGEAISDAAYSEYERAISAPNPSNARAIERFFGEPAGSIAGLLGYGGDDPRITARLDKVEAELGEIKELIRRLDRNLGRPADAPRGDGGSP